MKLLVPVRKHLGKSKTASQRGGSNKKSEKKKPKTNQPQKRKSRRELCGLRCSRQQNRYPLLSVQDIRWSCYFLKALKLVRRIHAGAG